jgi:hypothetical protein
MANLGEIGQANEANFRPATWGGSDVLWQNSGQQSVNLEAVASGQ